MDLANLRREGLNGPPAYRLLTSEVIGPDDDRLTVTKWARLPETSSRRFQVRDAAGFLLFDTNDCHDGGNALYGCMKWFSEREKQYEAARAAPDPALDFSAPEMMGPKDEPEPLVCTECGSDCGHDERCPVLAQELQHKADLKAEMIEVRVEKRPGVTVEDAIEAALKHDLGGSD